MERGGNGERFHSRDTSVNLIFRNGDFFNNDGLLQTLQKR